MASSNGHQPAPEVYTTAEFAACLKVSERTVKRLIQKELIESHKVGQRRLIPVSEAQRVAHEGIPAVNGKADA